MRKKVFASIVFLVTMLFATLIVNSATAAWNSVRWLGRSRVAFTVAAKDTPASLRRFADFKCDGVHDEEQIQLAIDRLPDAGGAILLYPGTYNVDQINLHGSSSNKDNITFQGSGHATVLKLNDMTRENILYADGCDNLVIRDLTLDGNNENQDIENWAKKIPGHSAGEYEIYLNNIMIVNSTNVIVENVLSKNAVNNGILFQAGVTDSVVRNCTVFNCYWHGIEFWRGGHGSSIVGCMAYNCYGSPIVVELGIPFDMYATVINCTTRPGNQGDDGDIEGIRVQTCGYVTLISNRLYAQRIRLSGADFCVIAENLVYNPSSDYSLTHGIRIAGNNNIITNNQIIRPYYDGIRIEGDRNIVNSNMIQHSLSTHAIHIVGTDSNRIINNYIYDWDHGHAIEIDTDSTNNEILRNRFEDVTVTTINDSGTGTVIQDNYP